MRERKEKERGRETGHSGVHLGGRMIKSSKSSLATGSYRLKVSSGKRKRKKKMWTLHTLINIDILTTHI